MNFKTNLNKFYVNLKLQKFVKLWLLILIILLLIMIMVGGITRLTNSGLSIVEWKPIVGIVPPLNHEGWVEEFNKYQASPQYHKINFMMKLKEFKSIYLWEYAHRLLARIIGIIFLVPFIYFAISKAFGSYYTKKLSIVLGFGIIQAFIGWYMVKSGLINNPYVSQYRLALHFSVALVIINLLFWVLLRILYSDQRFHLKFNRRALILNIWIFVQLISGAFVAGLDAGLTYNTFPLMDGKLIPSDLLMLKPFYLNFFDNIIMVQFFHRLNAMMLLIYMIYMLWYYRNNTLKSLIKITLVILIIQIILGISTLIMHVPIILGLAHQLNAVLLSLSGIFMLFIAKINRKASIRYKGNRNYKTNKTSRKNISSNLSESTNI